MLEHTIASLRLGPGNTFKMSPQTASKIRRPVQYWKPFNTWWRQAFDKTGRRPEAAAINR